MRLGLGHGHRLNRRRVRHHERHEDFLIDCALVIFRCAEPAARRGLVESSLSRLVECARRPAAQNASCRAQTKMRDHRVAMAPHLIPRGREGDPHGNLEETVTSVRGRRSRVEGQGSSVKTRRRRNVGPSATSRAGSPNGLRRAVSFEDDDLCGAPGDSRFCEPAAWRGLSSSCHPGRITKAAIQDPGPEHRHSFCVPGSPLRFGRDDKCASVARRGLEASFIASASGREPDRATAQAPPLAERPAQSRGTAQRERIKPRTSEA